MSLKGIFTSDFRIPGRKLLAVTLLFSNTLLLFYVFHDYLSDALLGKFGPFYVNFGNVLFFGFAVSCGIIGSLVLERIQRRKFLWFWLTLEVLTMLSVTIFQGLTFSLIFSALMGISFGLGFPTIQALVTEATTFEERGRVSTILFLIWSILFISIFMFSQELGITGIAAICAIAAASGFAALFIDPCERETGPTKTWKSIATSTAFVYYAIPWIAFQIANGLIVFGFLPQEFNSVVQMGVAVEFIAVIFSIIISGFLADLVGRKQPIIIGLVLLGISYSILGIGNTPNAYLAYSLIEGLAYGLIVVSYLQVVLGDLSSRTWSKERFFVLGGLLIFQLIYTIFSLVQAWFSIGPISLRFLTPTLAVLVFLSAIPVFYAPETMPEAKLREKKIKRHTEQVAELVKKYKKKE